MIFPSHRRQLENCEALDPDLGVCPCKIIILKIQKIKINLVAENVQISFLKPMGFRALAGVIGNVTHLV